VTLHAPERVKARIRRAECLRLFLDYDGTLAEFAPTPEHVDPDPEIIGLLTELAEHPRIRVTVISGRRLSHVEQLMPVPEVVLAGTYGVELLLPDDEAVDRVPFEDVRPVLDKIKPQWQSLITDRTGFFLEDKDWALAMHARFAVDKVADAVLEDARAVARSSIDSAPDAELFRILGGHKFLEVGPALANKGETVECLLDRYPWREALLLYVGDDDKDEEAFGVIHAHDGLAIRVCEEPCDTRADGRLESPEDTRRWLESLPSRLSRQRKPPRSSKENRDSH
jgi:trehalose 6-phosphate phosphatase